MEEIREAVAADREPVGVLLHEVFRDDPVSRWVFPDPAHREIGHPRLFGAFLDMAMAHGTVHLTADGAGAALWFSVRGGRLEGEEFLEEQLAAVDPGNQQLPAMGELTEAVHPVERDHAYLQAIAVAPARQGQGLGSALLRLMLERCDEERLPAYLEASNSRSRALYERHGFVVLGEAVELPDGPPMWAMWRDPA